MDGESGDWLVPSEKRTRAKEDERNKMLNTYVKAWPPRHHRPTVHIILAFVVCKWRQYS
jgi:hypothetical protein